ncbi:class I SAM-dependent methyltransferase [Amycolatopsis sp. NPDC050768]|uniref:class I SAM-dependent methyltransferase n=1 Tax=Amycolatopsis sp. NPDC050768 TaxID=3154839 RepID=UPI0033E7D65E
MAANLTEFYGHDTDEDTRLTRSAHGKLEFLRTQELVRRALNGKALRVLDVGGGTGVHARWLAADGHSVHVVDAVPRHVEVAAGIPGVTAELGDARALTWPDASADVVLLFGPLYHLVEAEDRTLALAEALRVLRPGGLLCAAAISRYLSLLEVSTTGRLDARMAGAVGEVIGTGKYDGHVGFVPAHFHTAAELGGEVRTAGVRDVEVFGVEGPAWAALDVAGAAIRDEHLESALQCARLVERDSHLINASAHLLAVGKA